jgi:hypothetical protein
VECLPLLRRIYSAHKIVYLNYGKSLWTRI